MAFAYSMEFGIEFAIFKEAEGRHSEPSRTDKKEGVNINVDY
jgi:hypothetical protein